MVDALNEASDDEAKNWSENKKFGREIGFEIDPPKVSWNENFKELYKKSNKLLSGIVQNWYFKCGKGRVYRWRI